MTIYTVYLMLWLKNRVRKLELALQEILEEATGDKDWDIVETAARGALCRDEDREKEDV